MSLKVISLKQPKKALPDSSMPLDITQAIWEMIADTPAMARYLRRHHPFLKMDVIGWSSHVVFTLRLRKLPHQQEQPITVIGTAFHTDILDGLSEQDINARFKDGVMAAVRALLIDAHNQESLQTRWSMPLLQNGQVDLRALHQYFGLCLAGLPLVRSIEPVMSEDIPVLIIETAPEYGLAAARLPLNFLDMYEQMATRYHADAVDRMLKNHIEKLLVETLFDLPALADLHLSSAVREQVYQVRESLNLV